MICGRAIKNKWEWVWRENGIFEIDDDFFQWIE